MSRPGRNRARGKGGRWVTAKARVQTVPSRIDEDCDGVAARLPDAIAAEQVPAAITRLALQLQAAPDARNGGPGE